MKDLTAMNPTKYININTIVNELSARIHAELGSKLIGIYLHGSLALEDFDEKISDIDLFVVTASDIDDNDFVKLDQMHKQFTQKHTQWNDRIEIAYASINVLQTPVNQQNKIAVISPGEPFNIKNIGTDWLINWYIIREHGISIYGDQSKKLIPPISTQTFVDAVKRQALEWQDWITHTKNSRSYQGYSILTLCRALYVCKNKAQASKIKAAQWTMDEFPELANQIQKAIQWREEYKNKDIDHRSTYPETVAFVNFITDIISKNEPILLYDQIVEKIIVLHFNQLPKHIKHITIGICNEVYEVGLDDKDVIVRISLQDKYLMGSHDHIPKLRTLGINVPEILAEDYSKIQIPFSYQIQSKIEGHDLGVVIKSLTNDQIRHLAREIAEVFNKIATIPASDKYGVIWGGGEADLSNTWTERMRIWIDESLDRGYKTGIMNEEIADLADGLYYEYQSYFDQVKPITYFGDICSKNVMIKNGAFSGLVDLDGLTQGDPLEAVGRIKLSWYGTHHGKVYTDAIMDEMQLNMTQRKMVAVYALLNQISWMCENGIQFNQNTKPVVDNNKEQADKKIIEALAAEFKTF